MSFRIETAMLSDDEADRLYLRRPELRAGPHEYCPTCRKQGTYLWQGVEHPCDCVRQLQLRKHYSAAGIGDTYQRLDWTDLDLPGEQVLLPKILKYLEHHQRYVARGIGLLFYGSIGTGKTMVANLVLKQLIKEGYTCFATTFSETIEAFTSTWGAQDSSRGNKEWFARKFMRSQVLLLDDLGRELMTRTNLAQSTFDMILRARVQDGRPTLLTTNCSPGELSTGYGAQVLSLITEQSMSYNFEGLDFRPRAQRRNQAETEAGEVRPII